MRMVCVICYLCRTSQKSFSYDSQEKNFELNIIVRGSFGHIRSPVTCPPTLFASRDDTGDARSTAMRTSSSLRKGGVVSSQPHCQQSRSNKSIEYR